MKIEDGRCLVEGAERKIIVEGGGWNLPSGK